ncbi:Hypothetical predicted protein [Podarcis lilfordi]|uniref:Secreted protein n=1 Tax=Podarcis lilfordi TaxID=74358 RepID=A0AA35KAC6_9SAUR|nr:Hypothetical predicted protein [Podarcis lilfordi]
MSSHISASPRLAQLFVAAALATSFPGEWGWPGGASQVPVGQCEEAPLFGVAAAAAWRTPKERGEEAKGTFHKGGCSKKGERLPALQARGDITGFLSPTGML